MAGNFPFCYTWYCSKNAAKTIAFRYNEEEKKMKTLKKVLKRIVLTLLLLIAVLVTGTAIYLNYESVLARHKIADVKDYAASVTELTIPDSAKVVALGEASHGNAEFQELKLTVLQELVENYGFTAFALELDFGEGIAINEYILGGDGSSSELLENTTFPIYHTQQMQELIEWMRSYNATVSEDKKIRFYGFDMQMGVDSAKYLTNFCREHSVPGIDDALDAIAVLTDYDFQLDETNAAPLEESLETIYAALEEYGVTNASDDFNLEYETALQATRALLQTVDNWLTDTPYFEYRDRCMADNVLWVLNTEEKIGSGKIMIAGHNGHVALSDDEFTCMGQNLRTDLGEAYYAIGTDYFTADVNIHDSTMMYKNPQRRNHRFCSQDPLAYQARYMDDEMYFLDFSSVPEESSELYDQLHTDMRMANVGEGYMWLWYIFVDSIRPAQVPAELYDGMIYVYDAEPISVWE